MLVDICVLGAHRVDVRLAVVVQRRRHLEREEDCALIPQRRDRLLLERGRNGGPRRPVVRTGGRLHAITLRLRALDALLHRAQVARRRARSHTQLRWLLRVRPRLLGELGVGGLLLLHVYRLRGTRLLPLPVRVRSAHRGRGPALRLHLLPRLVELHIPLPALVRASVGLERGGALGEVAARDAGHRGQKLAALHLKRCVFTRNVLVKVDAVATLALGDRHTLLEALRQDARGQRALVDEVIEPLLVARGARRRATRCARSPWPPERPGRA